MRQGFTPTNDLGAMSRRQGREVRKMTFESKVTVLRHHVVTYSLCMCVFVFDCKSQTEMKKMKAELCVKVQLAKWQFCLSLLLSTFKFINCCGAFHRRNSSWFHRDYFSQNSVCTEMTESVCRDTSAQILHVLRILLSILLTVDHYYLTDHSTGEVISYIHSYITIHH